MFNKTIEELIDTLWNVNQRPLRSQAKDNNELIDTLWNVNLSLYFPLQLLLRELIDTLWNVNTYEEIKEAGIQLN